jgi:chemotaxis protein methyltransferase CheR
MDESIDQACLDGFIKLTHDLTGITIKPERKSMLVGRLRRRVRDLDLKDFNEYLEYVRQQSNEHELFVNQVTTNETYFFRTPRVWEYIEQTFLPRWQELRTSPILHVWSAASSTGEEAHTIGILLQSFSDSHPGFDYRIHGTDIDTFVLEKAKLGVYRGRSIERFRQAMPNWFNRYMIGNDADGYEVLPNIKSRIQFNQFNLFSAPPSGPKFDLVLLRNVLIYFTKTDQENVLSTAYGRMAPGAALIIGESESLNSLNTGFEFIAPTIYQAAAQELNQAA